MSLRTRCLFLSVVVFSLALTACASDEPPDASPTLLPPTSTQPDDQDLVYGEAPIEHIDVQILESFPVQVRVSVSGDLPDGCTGIDQITQKREGNTFFITITTTRPAGVPCTEALVPYGETISLDVLGLKAGTYTVNVNGRTETFELTVDNVPQEPGAGTPPPASGEIITGTANVESIELEILPSTPTQVNVVARGNLRDGCTTIDQITQRREADTLFATLTTARPADEMCTQALVPFEESISLEVEGLEAGTYTVNVNGVTDTLKLEVDNTP